MELFQKMTFQTSVFACEPLVLDLGHRNGQTHPDRPTAVEPEILNVGMRAPLVKSGQNRQKTAMPAGTGR
ncbi:MAG: hypothetical protein CMJ62_05770 [Planctomycetaceae bacterium]|nr:hypothetical protein [Planctomycetaceae bacterium]